MAAAKKGKDFSMVNERVQNALADAIATEPETQETQEAQEAQNKRAKYKPRRTYSEQEKQDYLENMDTAGRKGVKLKRINLAFSNSNYLYIQTMSRVRGETLTEFVNAVIKKSMETNKELYDQAKHFIDSLE